MIKHGEPPFLECSSKGTKCFSAFYAKIIKRDRNTIEEIYQASKVFEDGSTGLSWRCAKGRKPVNIEETSLLYSTLWDEYIEEHPELINILINSSGLSDMFGQEGHVCQATELWRIRNKYIKEGFNA
jgi:hypothetical protein